MYYKDQAIYDQAEVLNHLTAECEWPQHAVNMYAYMLHVVWLLCNAVSWKLCRSSWLANSMLKISRVVPEPPGTPLPMPLGNTLSMIHVAYVQSTRQLIVHPIFLKAWLMHKWGVENHTLITKHWAQSKSIYIKLKSRPSVCLSIRLSVCLVIRPRGGSRGGLWGMETPLQNTLGKQKEWCVVIKIHKNVLLLELNVILAVLKESIQFFLKGCTHHTPYTLLVKTTLIRKVLSICKHRK